MLEKIEQNCHNCGAPIDRRTMRCDYCGTRYKGGSEGVSIGIGSAIPGTHAIYAQVEVEYGLLERHPEEAKKAIEHKLAYALAKEILKYATVTTNDNYHNFNKSIRAKVEVVEPRDYASNESEEKMKELERRIFRSMLHWGKEQ